MELRQGENLSPLLLAVFLNDMNDWLSLAYNGLITVRRQAGSQQISIKMDFCSQLETEDTVTFLKLFLLLYADDTIIVAESVKGIASSLKRSVPLLPDMAAGG